MPVESLPDLVGALPVLSRRLDESIASYDHSASHFAEKYASATTARLRASFRSYLLPSSLPVLDAGCGTGRDIQGFEQEGVGVVGVDLSRGLLEQASRHVRDSPLILADFRALPFKDEAVRGVWAMASLVHLDRSEVLDSLREFSRVTLRQGPIFISVMEGTGSCWRPDPDGRRRWFQKHRVEDIGGLAEEADLTLDTGSRTAGSIGGEWLNLTLRTRI